MRQCLQRELVYKTSRSSGPGGQHVNKTESKVELYWNLQSSQCLSEGQKNLLKLRLASRLTDQGTLILASEKHRSQYRNREEVTGRFMALIAASLVPPVKRHPTRPTRSSIEKRIQGKKIRGELKRSRGQRPEE